jgi:hypothetical protein
VLIRMVASSSSLRGLLDWRTATFAFPRVISIWFFRWRRSETSRPQPVTSALYELVGGGKGSEKLATARLVPGIIVGCHGHAWSMPRTHGGEPIGTD